MQCYCDLTFILIDRFVISVVLHYDMLLLTRIQYWRLYVNTNTDTHAGFQHSFTNNALLLLFLRVKISFFLYWLVRVCARKLLVKKEINQEKLHTQNKQTHTEPHIYKTHTATHTQTIIIKWIKLKWIIIHNEHATFFVLNFLSICIFIKYIKHTHTHSHSHFLKQTQMDNGHTHIQNHWIKPLYRKNPNSKKIQ